MDKNERAKEQLQKAIISFVSKAIKNAPFDRTQTGYIKTVNTDNSYNVVLNGIEYQKIRTIGGKCVVNETIRVLIPQNNPNNMFILKA